MTTSVTEYQTTLTLLFCVHLESVFTSGHPHPQLSILRLETQSQIIGFLINDNGARCSCMWGYSSGPDTVPPKVDIFFFKVEEASLGNRWD